MLKATLLSLSIAVFATDAQAQRRSTSEQLDRAFFPVQVKSRPCWQAGQILNRSTNQCYGSIEQADRGECGMIEREGLGWTWSGGRCITKEQLAREKDAKKYAKQQQREETSDLAWVNRERAARDNCAGTWTAGNRATQTLGSCSVAPGASPTLMAGNAGAGGGEPIMLAGVDYTTDGSSEVAQVAAVATGTAPAAPVATGRIACSSITTEAGCGGNCHWHDGKCMTANARDIAMRNAPATEPAPTEQSGPTPGLAAAVDEVGESASSPQQATSKTGTGTTAPAPGMLQTGAGAGGAVAAMISIGTAGSAEDNLKRFASSLNAANNKLGQAIQ